MKLYCFIAVLIALNARANEINITTPEGFTLLHCTAMLPEDFKNTSMEDIILELKEKMKDKNKFDLEKAQIAARLVFSGASVHKLDWTEKTPLFYSEKNKNMLPSVYEVMQIGEECEMLRMKYNQYKNEQIFKNEYFGALNKLIKYMPPLLKKKSD